MGYIKPEAYEKHKTVIEWFYEDNNHENGVIEIDAENEYIKLTKKPKWKLDKRYVINDEYVDYRMALIEGKRVSIVDDFGFEVPLTNPNFIIRCSTDLVIKD